MYFVGKSNHFFFLSPMNFWGLCRGVGPTEQNNETLYLNVIFSQFEIRHVMRRS